MLRAYIDESYLEGNVHLIGALVLTARQAGDLTYALDDVIWKTHHANREVPLDIELHGQRLFQRTGEWSCLRPTPRAANSVYRRALHRIVENGGAWFIGGIRRIDRLAPKYGRRAWPPHQIALQYTLELVNDYAKERGETVQIIADEVPDQAHHEARMQQFQIDGRTPGWKPNDFSCLEMPFRWESSRDHRPLQAVDLLTYLYLRKRFVNPTAHMKAAAAVSKMSEVARPILHKQHVWTP